MVKGSMRDQFAKLGFKETTPASQKPKQQHNRSSQRPKQSNYRQSSNTSTAKRTSVHVVQEPQNVDNEIFSAYDFIDIGQPNQTYSVKDKGDYTGELTVTLTTVSPLIAVKQFSVGKEDPTVIPASSIRGCIRNAAEIIWDELLTVTHGLGQKELAYVPASDRINNANLAKHYLANHLFGFTVNEKNKIESAASKLKFTDATTNETQRAAEVSLSDKALYSPTFSKNYKKEGQDIIAGRKVYLAGRMKGIRTLCMASNVPEPLAEYVGIGRVQATWKKIMLIYPNTTYTFKIQFDRLTKEQIAHLIRVIELDSTATHALGQGKPLGFGRIRMHVEEVKIQQRDQLFNLATPIASNTLNKEELLALPDPFKKKRREFEILATADTFDNKKQYKSKQNPNVVQYTKYKKKG